MPNSQALVKRIFALNGEENAPLFARLLSALTAISDHDLYYSSGPGGNDLRRFVVPPSSATYVRYDVYDFDLRQNYRISLSQHGPAEVSVVILSHPESGDDWHQTYITDDLAKALTFLAHFLSPNLIEREPVSPSSVSTIDLAV